MLTNAQKRALEPQQTEYMKRVAEISESVLSVLDGREKGYEVGNDPLYLDYMRAKSHCQYCRADLSITEDMVDEVASKAAPLVDKYK